MKPEIKNTSSPKRVKINQPGIVRFELPPYRIVFDGMIELIPNSTEVQEPFWNTYFKLIIVEALPGAWLSKITKDFYRKPLAAYDPAVIYLLTKEHAEWLNNHAAENNSAQPNLPNFYQRGDVPRNYDEWNFNPDEIYPGQRFFILEPIKTTFYDDFDPMIIEAQTDPGVLEKLWVGIAIAEQTDWAVVGQHTMEVWLHNMSTFPPKAPIWLQISGYQFGPGGGVSGGLSLVVLHGVSERNELPDVTGGWDFEISIGAKLTGFLKSAKLIKIAKTLTKTGKVLDKKKYKALKYVGEGIIKNRDAISKPGIITLPIPLLGAGAHLWGGYKFSDVKLLSWEKSEVGD